MRGSGAGLARPALTEPFVGCRKDRLLVLGAMPAHVAPREVEQPPGPGHSPALAYRAEGKPGIERHAEALDWRFAGLRPGLSRCHRRDLSLKRLCDNTSTRYCCHMTNEAQTAKVAAFKAKARTLDTPSLRVLWDALKADDSTSLELLLWTGAEYERRVKAEA